MIPTSDRCLHRLLDEGVIDLLQERDSGFVGAIGEFVAWRYLWRRGILCLRFAANASLPSWNPKSPRHCRGLNKEQISYLRNLLYSPSERRYDFIGYARGGDQYQYLIEVKTSRKEGVKHDYKKRDEDIQRARELGFTPLLVRVEFLSSWKFRITHKEL